MENTKLYHYDVRIFKTQGDYDWNRDKFINEVVDIAVQNEDYIVINDWYFTKIKKEKSSYENYLNKPSISIRATSSYDDEGISYTLYSEKPVTPKKIKTEIEREVNKRYGWLLRGLDLSIIK